MALKECKMISLTGMIEKECHYSLIALSLSPRSCSNAKGYCRLLAGNYCFWLEILRFKINVKLTDDADDLIGTLIS